MNRSPADDPFPGLEPPALPPALRGRVLARAREALARGETPDVWTRIWESRPLRVTWAAATLLLVAAHLAVPVRPAPPGNPRRAAPAAAVSDAASELAAVASLAPLKEDVLPRLDAPAAPSAPPPAPAKSAPAGKSRKESAS